MAKKKTKIQISHKCPKCGAKLKVSEFAQSCNRCGYFKSVEPSNLTKRLMGW